MDLASTSTFSSTSSVVLYTAIHSLLSSLLLPTPPASVADIANFFAQSLLPAIREAVVLSPPKNYVAMSHASRIVSDVIIDVVWQIDQSLDAMSVEDQELNRVKGVLAHLVKLLIVSYSVFTWTMDKRKT